jgi:hypothetical protein
MCRTVLWTNQQEDEAEIHNDFTFTFAALSKSYTVVCYTVELMTRIYGGDQTSHGR